ncbi:MAG TPA: aldo/keto reductase [Kribbellaceae bacterium]|nr:aldo/keto reductase [Kribbellaceae bacterium]
MRVIERVGVGLAALGRPAYINLGRVDELPAGREVDVLRAASFEVLDAAYDAGVRWVDVARSYGLAEEFLAGWLDDRGHTDVTVSSKWGYAYVGDWRMDAQVHEAKEHSLARFTAQWAESRALLGDAIALYQVHSLTADSPLFDDQPLLEAMAGLAAGGVRLGFSTSGPHQADTVRRAFALEVAGERLFSAVQSTWNLLETSAGPALAEAHEAGATVLVKETLANGRLAAEPPAALADLARAHRVGADAVALAAVLAQRWADVVLAGPSSTQQLASNLAAADLRLDPAELVALGTLPEDPVAYWSRRSGLPWR